MHSPRLRFTLVLAFGVTLLCSTAAAQEMPRTGAGSPWVLAPPFFTRGALITLVGGDPDGTAPFEVKLAFPRGYRMLPHFHSAPLHIQVLEGTMQVGIGERMDRKKMMTVTAGDTATVPAGARYYYTTSSVTILQVQSTGPFTVTYANDAENPARPKPF